MNRGEQNGGAGGAGDGLVRTRTGGTPGARAGGPGDPQWFRDAILYELRIRSYYDSDGDGIGDIRGLTSRLDYLQDLGVTAIWLLPFYPSPLRDDGYDIADYKDVHPQCGTLRDFKELLREAHARGLKVVTELVLNHTSDQHPWFQRARRSPAGSKWRDFYVWTDDPTQYAEARIIFTDYETSNWAWDPVAGAYYWHRFFSNQPDLNFDNPTVRKELFKVLDFWLSMGVDGVRLDAIPYLFERDGTSCENLPETHEYLKQLRAHVDARYEGRMLLAEANQWPEDSAAYFGDGDECHMCFHFPLMPRLFMSLEMEDRFPLYDILEQMPAIPEGCQWALFLRNHDELTLEMVTEEERDYMWRVYSRDPRMRINLGIRRRLAPLLGNSRRRIELLNALLFSLPGTPILYYGDEIGMGDNVYLGDRNGVRTPMQWSADRNAGFSRANPQKLFLPVVQDPEYNYETVNVETQQANPNAILWWTKRMIALRKQYPCFGRGTLELLRPSNRKVVAFLRRLDDEVILVVANLSRFAQFVELDLSAFGGYVPTQLFGNVEFPVIGDRPYLLTLSPHDFHWLALTHTRAIAAHEPVAGDRELPWIDVEGGWQDAFRGRQRARLEAVLPPFLVQQRWFARKAQRIRAARVLDVIPLRPVRSGRAVGTAAVADAAGATGATGAGATNEAVYLLIVEVTVSTGESDTYVIPVSYLAGDARPVRESAALVHVRSDGGEHAGTLVEASDRGVLATALYDLVRRRKRIAGESLALQGHFLPALKSSVTAAFDPAAVRPLRSEQSNTSWILDDRLIGKLLRRLEEGENPEVEMGRRLAGQSAYRNSPALTGHVVIEGFGSQGATFSVLHEFVPSEGDAWSLLVQRLGRFLEGLLTQPPEQGLAELLMPEGAWPGPAEVPGPLVERAGACLEMARSLGRRTAQLHRALSSGTSDSNGSAFTVTPFTGMDRRSLYESLRGRGRRALDLLRTQIPGLDEATAALASQVLDARPQIDRLQRDLLRLPDLGARIRCHGDLHLGQVLVVGDDVVIIDFEGEPARPLGERRLKRSPLTDVAGMIRSFDYAARLLLTGRAEGYRPRPEDVPRLEGWIDLWYAWMRDAYLSAYSAEIPAGFLPVPGEARRALLAAFLIDKAFYEVAYELGNRPAWVALPLEGILRLVAGLHAEADA